MSSIELTQSEVRILLRAIEQVTRLGVWNDEYDKLSKKLAALQ